MVISGGPVFSAIAVVIRASALALGTPETGPAALAAAAVVLVITAASLVILDRKRSGEMVLFAVAIALSPALLLLTTPPQLLYVRYFLLGALFFVLLLSYLAGHVYRWGAVGRIIYITMMLGYVLGNSFYTADLLRYGRGQYVDAMKHMVENTPDDVVAVGSDHDFRNRAILDFYAARMASTKRIVYYEKDTWPPSGLDWMVLHNWASPVAPSTTVTDSFGHIYSLDRIYPYARLSGWHWFLYRRVH
jgi:hypothetical protein